MVVLRPTPAHATPVGIGPALGEGLLTSNTWTTPAVWFTTPSSGKCLFALDPTIDMESTEVEVYGRRKKGVAYNYAGQQAGRPHLVTWA